MNQRLYRSREDRIIFGVAGGIARQFKVDPSLIRILWVLLAFATAGLAILLYVAMAFIVPEEPAGDDRWAGWETTQGGYTWPESGTSAAASAPAAPSATAGPTSTAAPGAAGDGRGALFFGLLLVLVGGYFLVREYLPSINADRAWPILLVVLGVLLLLGSFRRSPGPSA